MLVCHAACHAVCHASMSCSMSCLYVMQYVMLVCHASMSCLYVMLVYYAVCHACMSCSMSCSMSCLYVIAFRALSRDLSVTTEHSIFTAGNMRTTIVLHILSLAAACIILRGIPNQLHVKQILRLAWFTRCTWLLYFIPIGLFLAPTMLSTALVRQSPAGWVTLKVLQTGCQSKAGLIMWHKCSQWIHPVQLACIDYQVIMDPLINMCGADLLPQIESTAIQLFLACNFSPSTALSKLSASGFQVFSRCPKICPLQSSSLNGYI
jgi:hypothetical protein